MTLIAGIMGSEGLILAADTEEQISSPNSLRTRAEKLHVFNGQQPTPWTVAITGAGDSDWIGMARDFIEEAIHTTEGSDRDISRSIKSAIREMWKHHVRYEQGTVDLSLLIGSFSSDHRLRFTVVRGSAVRSGRSLEAMGVGDSVFRSLADHYLNYGTFSFVPGDMEVLRYFVIYAMQQAKAVPGVGGNTRVVTLSSNGILKWEKSFKIWEVSSFFADIESDLRSMIGKGASNGEDFVRHMSKTANKRIGKLRKELERIKKDSSLL